MMGVYVIGRYIDSTSKIIKKHIGNQYEIYFY